MVQLSETNPFGEMELDKAIEVTINYKTKTSGDTSSSSKSNDAINGWSLKATYRADMWQCLHKMLQIDKKSTIHSDLTVVRVKNELEDIRPVTEILTEIFLLPFSNSPLLCISNGTVTKNESF